MNSDLSVLSWVAPERCSTGGCVAVALDAGRETVLVRDTKTPDGPTLVYNVVGWGELLTSIQIGLVPNHGPYTNDGIVWTSDGVMWTHDGIKLRFDDGEWLVFWTSVILGHVDPAALASAGAGAGTGVPVWSAS